MQLKAFPGIAIMVMLLTGLEGTVTAQSAPPLLLSDAINTGLKNYQSIQAKQNYLQASAELVKSSRKEY